MLRAFVVIVLVKLALAAPPNLVPAVTVLDAKNKGFILQPNQDGYQLAIRGTGGSRVEDVAADDEGQLQVQGVFKQKFENKLQLIVKYIADTNGYHASYKLRVKKKKEKKPTKKPGTDYVDKPDFPDDDDEDKPVVITTAIKVECLRSCAG